jgi:spermidine synthase
LRPLLFVAFWASGVAGLLYELAWSRYLALFVGHAAYAQVLVISVFLGGLAVGSLAVGDKSRNLRRPLAWYAAAELVLCLAGIAFHPAFRGITGLAYDSWLPALGSPALAGVVQWGVAGLLILPQSVLLGTTFPLMAAGALRLDPRGAGNTVALLYFVNSLGGAGGVLLGGFVLIAWAGLPGAVLGAAALNAVAAGLALWVSGRAADRSSAAGELERAALADSPWTLPDRVSQQGLWSVLLGLSFFTALASFIYEIGWIRMLSLVMGSATHSFEIMLSAFILGLAIGSWWIRRAVDRSTRPLRLLGWIQWTMGLTALATLPVYEGMFDVMAFLVRALPEREGAYALFSLSRYGMALAVMLPSTICAGMSLPLITGTLLHAGAGERSLGWVYGINTLGSVVGVALAGLLLLPSLGLQGMLVAGAALDMALGVALFAYAAWAGWGVRRRLVPLAAVAGAGAAALVVSSARFDEAVLTSGVFRYGTVPNPDDRAMLFYRDGRTATVAVHRESSGLTVQSTNGKPDASLGERWMRSISEDLEPAPIYWQDEATQVLVAVAVMAHAPAARSAAMVGHGSGITGHYLLAKPDLERLVTIEIEPEMIRGSRLYYPANRRVFDDPRSVVVIDDAKAYFSNRQERFEVIVSEPSNPWVSGTASLFTVEFYQRLGDYLTDDGVFGQWFQLYEMTDESVVSVLTALHQGFRHYRAFLVGTTDLMVIATNADRLPDPDWDVARYPALVEDLSHVHPLDPIHLNATRVFDSETLRPVLESGALPNSDYYPRLDLAAERSRFLDSFASGFYGFCSDRFDVVAALEGRRAGFVPYAPVPAWGIAQMRARALGAWLRDDGWLRSRWGDAPAEEYTRAGQRYAAFLAGLDGTGRPASWPNWARSFLAVEESLHGGTAGVADSLLYGRARTYVEAADAPPEARAVVEYMYGLAAWDFAAAAGAADVLVPAAAEGETWIEAELLLDGSVVAYLAMGDSAGADRAIATLVPHTGRSPDDFRTSLLRAYVREGLAPAAAAGQ